MTNKSHTTAATQPQGESIGEFVRTIIFAFIIAMLIRTVAFEPFNIPSSSMVPTLLIGDFLFVSKYSYGYGSAGTFWSVPDFKGRVFDREPARGDVIVFKWPHDNSTDYIKRLIGLPGDRIQMRHGILYINDMAVPRDRLSVPVPLPHNESVPANITDYQEHLPGGVTHIIRKEGDEMPLDNTEVFVVPAHHYFFMGDNRDNSEDSRAKNGGVGFVPEENLVGKAEFLFFSLDGDTHFWEVWKWPKAVRWDRLFTKIK